MGEGRFRQEAAETIYRETDRKGYRYLTPETGPSPTTERCCTELILTYGLIMQVAEVACPVCGTRWNKSTEPGWVPPREVFTNLQSADRYTIEQGPSRKYLRPDTRS